MSDVYEIAASGMAAQRTQMDLIADNLANAGVVRADGGVFRPKTAVLTSEPTFEPLLRSAALRGDDSFGEFAFAEADDMSGEPAGAVVAEIVEQPRGPQYRFDPGNPFAVKSGSHKGFVTLPDIDPIEQMVALVSSGRAYDANVSMLQAAKQMDIEAADIGRA